MDSVVRGKKKSLGLTLSRSPGFVAFVESGPICRVADAHPVHASFVGHGELFGPGGEY